MMLDTFNFTIPGYRPIEQLHQGATTLVYRAVSIDQQSQPVIIKFLTCDYPSQRDLLQFRHQYTIAKQLDLPGVIRPYQLLEYRRGYALVMEDFGGISLNQYQARRCLSVTDILSIAIQLADILHALYQQRIVHKDIKPANILIHPESKQIKLIDFGIASLLPRETQEILSPNLLEGTLAYISPEQTGRMNRGIDYRTDFYSLGVTLYQLLTGKLPFETGDPIKSIHCHLAQVPIPVDRVNPDLPGAIAAIVAKLMAKNVENRYQSALGLKFDLENCLTQLAQSGEIGEFELGRQDLSDRFIIPEKLYGRETEVQALLDSFERVAQGSSELMLVAGFSGIGKTAVINEVHKPITRQHGYFIKGKFDQFNRNIPLSAFLQAVREAIGQLWSQSDTQLAIWKAQILAAVGENGRVLIEVIPELERIIGSQPPIPVLSGSAAQNRFNRLFQKFIQVFTTADHPLVIFIDDLQWADLASLQLLKLLIEDGEHLLILGAYRDNEVLAAHPLLLTVRELHQKGATVNTIDIQRLNRGDINQLVADTLICDRALALPLSELIDRKTQGNPFFTTQFLKSLHQDGYIQFNRSAGYWQCDLAQIQVQSLTDDVVALMALQLQKLEPASQSILKLAACVGAQFDLQTLAMVSELSTVDAAARLWSAIQEGLVIPIDRIYKFFQAESADSQNRSASPRFDDSICNYRFLHDRVQQAAYSLIPPSQTTAVHLQIGRLLLDRSTTTVRESNLFQIVNQLNFGVALIQSAQERADLATLNWQAGVKARSAAAYDAAMNYLDTGLALLSPQCWQHQYTLSLGLHHLAAEVAYLSGNYPRMNALIEIGLQQAKNDLDRAKFYETQILALVAQGRSRESIAFALQILPKFGIHLPARPSQFKTTVGFFQTVYRMAGKTPQNLLALPMMTDPYKLAGFNLVNLIGAAAQRGMPEMLPFITFTGIFLSLRYGNIPKSSMGYIIYAFLLCEKLGRIEEGYAIGRAAIDLCHQTASNEALASTLFLWNRFVSYRKESLHSTLPSLLEGYQISLEVGDTEYAAYNLSTYLGQAYETGQHLLDLKQEAISHRTTFDRLQQKAIANLNDLLCQHLEHLTVGAEDVCALVGPFFDETTIPTDDLQLLIYTALRKLDLALLFDRPAVTIEQLRIVNRVAECIDGTISYHKIGYYQAMLRLAQYPHQTKRQQAVSLKQIQKISQRLRQLARFSPLNFQHQVLIIEAELMRVLGRSHQAGEYYDRAIASAKTNRFSQDEALANELAAKFYLSCGKEKFAAIYMQEAYDCYLRWGATAKVKDLANRYPQLLTTVLQQSSRLTEIDPFSRSLSIASESVDLATLFNAAQAISGEIELDKLSTRLLKIGIANAGADKCVLLLQLDQKLQIVAVVESGQQPQLRSSPTPLDISKDVAISLVNRVKHSLEPLVLSDARENFQLGDRYLLQHQPQSVLCSPILHQGKLLGILYLENRLTKNVFTRDRLEVLTILCSQAAIALENARLFNAEQEKSQALSASLAQLQQSELRFKNLFEKSTDAIMLLNGGRLIDCNEAAVKLFGYSCKSQIWGLHPAQISPEVQPDGQSSIEKANLTIDQALSAGSNRFEWVHQRLDQELFWAEVILTPILWEGSQILHAIVRDISDRKQAEMALIQSESKFRSLVEDTSDLIYALDLDGIFTYISPQVEEVLGYQPSDLLGQPCAEFTHAEDLHLVFAQIQQLLETGTKQNGIELRVPRKDGGWSWIVFNNSPIKDATGQIIGIQGIGRDVTAQKATIQERQLQSEALQTIVTGTVGKTGQAFYQTCTKLLAEIFNVQYAFLTRLIDDSYTKSQMLSLWTGSEFLEPYEMGLAGTPCLATYQNNWGIFPRDLQAQFPEATALASLEGESYISVTIEDFNGQIIGNLGVIDTKPLPSDTSLLKFILQLFANRVAAEMKRQVDEDELRQTNQQLNLTNQELIRATRLKDEFLANMSHELRTPLNAILGFSQSLQEEIQGALNPRQHKAIATIERSGEHLLALINDILEVSKIEAGKLELDISSVNVASLCSSSLAFVKQQALTKQIQLTTNIAPNLGKTQADERRLRQVLINLLTNAVKFTPPGGRVALDVRLEHSTAELLPVLPSSEANSTPKDAAQVEEISSEPAAWLIFAITDTGIGIAAADLTKLFQPFVQIDSSLNRQYEGTGLGLTLVKQIVELHDGTVSVDSTIGQGSCFSVRLPYRCPVETTIATPVENPSLALTQSVTPTAQYPLILLAEDNQANIDTLSVYLECQDYRLVIARNGQEAIDLTQAYQPDLILMDIQMPGVDGLTAIKTIREDLHLTKIPIVALTALAMSGDRERCLAVGASDYLSKPVKMSQLLTLLHLMLSRPSAGTLEPDLN